MYGNRSSTKRCMQQLLKVFIGCKQKYGCSAKIFPSFHFSNDN
jgi:hypothetical protein